MEPNKLSETNEHISEIFTRVIEKNRSLEELLNDLPKILKALAYVDSESERNIYIERLSSKFGIDKRAITKDIKKYNSHTPDLKKKTSLTSLTPPVEIIEVIKTDQGLRYCLPDFEMKDSIEVDGVVYQLPQQVNLVKLPTERFIQIGFTEDENSLFKQVEEFIHDHLDLQEDFGFKVLTLYIFHTWLLDKFDTSPILHFLGAYASGKSRAGDTIGVLAKRGLCTVNLTGAPIFRVSEAYQPTLIIDEVKLTGKDRDRDILELLNARFQRGRKVIRINTDKSDLDSIQEFNVFGATVLSGLDELPETPRSRAIVFIMEQNVRPVAKGIDLKRADLLRDRLCAFRGSYLEERMPQVDRFIKDGRLADAIEPLHQILKLVKPEIEPDFIEYFKKIENERREELFDSFDAEVVRALLKCRGKVENKKVLVSDVTFFFNEGKNESDCLNIRTIGKVLTRLKLKKTRASGKLGGKFARFWDEKRIERLCRKYDLGDLGSELSELSEDSDDKKGDGKNNNPINLTIAEVLD